ncbi:hypothetical protein V8E52_004643 [Russula decolorans]
MPSLSVMDRMVLRPLQKEDMVMSTAMIKPNFWNTLSSGQFLCVAYKIGVRQSRKPWGHINDDSIHDIVALEDALSASAVDGSQAESGRKG